MSQVSLAVSKDFIQAFRSGEKITSVELKTLAEKFVAQDFNDRENSFNIDLNHVKEALRFMGSDGYSSLGLIERKRHDRIYPHQNLDQNIGEFLQYVLDYIYTLRTDWTEPGKAWLNLSLDSKRLFLPYLGLGSCEDITDIFTKCVFGSVTWIDQLYQNPDDREKEAIDVFVKAFSRKVEKEITPKLQQRFNVETADLANQADDPLFSVDVFDVFYRHSSRINEFDKFEIRTRYFVYETNPKLSSAKKQEIADFIMDEIKKIPEFKDFIRVVQVVIETQPKNDGDL